jgi:hypothetical protein
VLTSPWSDEIPGYLTRAELDAMYGPESSDENVDRAIELGLVIADGDRFRVPSPRLLHAGAELVAAGIPLPEVLDLAAALQADMRATARRLVGAVVTHILSAHEPNWVPGAEELPELVELVSRLRPLAQMAVDGLLAAAMETEVRAVLGERFISGLDVTRPELDTGS